MEIVALCFFLLGVGCVFLAKGWPRLAATLENAILILSAAFLSMIVGVLAVSMVLGDPGAGRFLTFLEARGRVSRTGIKVVVSSVSLLSLLGLCFVLGKAR